MQSRFVIEGSSCDRIVERYSNAKYQNVNYDLYRETLNNCLWDYNNLSINDQAKLVTNNIFEAAEVSVPNRVVTIRPKDPPWMHNDIRKSIRQRNRTHKLAKSTNDPTHWARFREARNRVTTLIRNSKINYFKKLATSLQQGNLSSKDWWKITKQFLKQNKDSDIPPLIKNGNHFNSPEDKASLFNSYFCDQSTIDDSQATLPPCDIPNNILNEIHITADDVSDVLRLIDTTKACGPDFISPKLLREGGPSLSHHLANLFNNSLNESTFPSDWKLANVIPVYKKGDKTDVANYRPISLLSCIGKVFERCVFKHLHNYIVANNLITPLQSGFTPSDSATFQLIDLYNTFVKALDDGKEVRVIFCDISKAFDRVWHRGLLFKLRRMGVSGKLLDWFISYLSQRFQRVAMEGCVSDYIQIQAGVPQGSILGPLLFLIYINDIVNDIGSSIRLFADDTTLYLVVDDPNHAANLLNDDIEKIHNWSNKWLVKFNPNKTEELILSRKTVPPNHPPLFMNNVQIKQVQQHKHLGVTFNNKCTWSDHISDITTRAWKRIHVLRSLKFNLDRKTLEIMYLSFIRPILEYADCIWDNCNNQEINEIEKIQIEAGRIVTGATKSCSKIKILEETGWDSLQTRRYKHRMITFYKIIGQHGPRYLFNLLPPSAQQVSHRNLRSANTLRTYRCRTNMYQNSYLPKTVQEWNLLPENVKKSPSIQVFKNYLNRNNTKVPNYYYNGGRKAQILHARLRLGCSSLNADLFSNHVANSPNCVCGEPETAEHYLLHCRLHNAIRSTTIHQLNYNINIEILLKGCPLYDDRVNGEIFAAVHNFIQNSQRFD